MMKALDMVTNPHTCWCEYLDADDTNPMLNWTYIERQHCDYKHHDHNEGALTTMRALVAWMETDCTNPDHWDFYDRDHGTRADCQHCWAELKAALEVNDG